MTKRIITLILLTCGLLGAQKGYSQEDIDRNYTNVYLVSERVALLVKYIPDHGMGNSRKEGFEPSFYNLLVHAFSVPSEGIGAIGREEWLYYFVTAQDDCECGFHPVKVTDYYLNGNKTAYVEVNYLHRNHNIVLYYDGSDWVMSDFDNVRTRLEQYIKEMRAYFLSSEWDAYVSNFIKEADDEWKQAAYKKLKEVEEYFRKYPVRKGENLSSSTKSSQRIRVEQLGINPYLKVK